MRLSVKKCSFFTFLAQIFKQVSFFVLIYLSIGEVLAFQAKSTLGFSPSINIDDITDEKLHAKFVQKLSEVKRILLNCFHYCKYCFVNKIGLIPSSRRLNVYDQ